ncbi:MAG: DUF413 domain-containing protein [Bacteroidales bacterium]|nr:DUF413 domain-containing protein [Bacteroidales bacterium]
MKKNELTRHHQDYIKTMGPFLIDCSIEIFSNEEREVLEKYGHWFQAITSEELAIFTPLQQRFVKVMKKEVDPFSVEEWAWLKYISRKEIEQKYNERLRAQYVPAEDAFYSRKMVKQLKKTMYKEMKDNHKL